ncbi:MAG: hypothetical protein ACREKE_10965 [bacterium]
MRHWKRWAGLGLLLCVGAAVLPAQGIYVLGGLGGKTVYDQDVSDFYGGASYWGVDEVGLADGALAVGWRFPGLMAVEASVTEDGGQSATDYVGPYSSSTLNIGSMTTLAIGPVVCWDHPSWWFAEDGVTEFGLKLEYASLSGSETETDPDSSTNFNASALGFGVFVRALNIWDPSGFSLGLEAGWDENYFGSLSTGGGQYLIEYAGSGDAYVDNSGGYVRLVIGWSQPFQHRASRRRPRFWRNRVHDVYPDNGAPGPGDTIPSLQQSYPGDQNYGN